MGPSVRRFGRLLNFTTLCLAASAVTGASGDIVTNVTFDDAGMAFAGYYPELTRQAQAAGRAWGRYLDVHPDAVMDLEIAFSTSIATATGGYRGSVFVANRDGFNVFEGGTAAELRDGNDRNGSAVDLRFTFSHNYILNEFWYDPDPDARVAAVPSGSLDAQSTFIHEYGHALGFIGWSDPFDGSLPGNYRSPFDELTVFDPGTDPGTSDDNLFFVGPSAMAVYGGAVPLTYGNSKHYGNDSPRPGSDLVDPGNPGLMNGVRSIRGGRRRISDLDVAILRDIGLPVSAVAIPEPSAMLAVVVGCFGLAVRRRRSSRVEI